MEKEGRESLIDVNAAMRLRVCAPVCIVGTATEIIKTLLEENMLFPKLKTRKLPFTKLEIKAATNETVRFHLNECQCLFDVVNTLCAEHHLRVTNKGDVIMLTA